jgi:hypothetical protein
MGATKVVVYDDGSADSNSPAKLLQPFGSSVVVNKVQDLGPIPADFWPEHAVAPFIQRMFWAYNHCGATYGGGKGWMAIMDTDEYLFPCRRDVSSNLQEAFAERLARSSLDALGVQVECLKFGFNDVNRSLTPGELQIEFHTHRWEV